MPDTWETLEHDCKNCRECSLWETRTNVVFGVGNQNAEVLFIGEGPGANEDAQGVPFVGRAGHLLDDRNYEKKTGERWKDTEYLDYLNV